MQFHAGFTFARALEIVPYLRDLGVSHVYTSPILAARPGSTHGYDIVDHRALNPELGGREGFEALSVALRNAGLGLVMDIVPNHMGIGGSENAWWLDVLEWGRASSYANYFDIQWFPQTQGLHDQVLLPVLGDLYGEILMKGEFRLRFDARDGAFSVWYYEHRFPICPTTYARILAACLEHAGARLAEDADVRAVFVESKRLRFKPRSGVRRKAQRTRGETFKAFLTGLAARLPELRLALDEAEQLFGPNAPDGRGLQRMHNLLEHQHFRPAFWRVAGYEINYRRFFQINDLAGLRVEDRDVFAASHGLIRELVAQGHVHGLRIDHIDGLYDPARYLTRLQQLVRPFAADLGFKPGRFPVYVEKILEEHETLRPEWPVHGTTGYDALSEINAVLHEPVGTSRLFAIFEAQEGPNAADAHVEGVRAKRQVMDQELASELEVLATETTRLLKRDPATRDFSRGEIRQALREIVAWFPVYRTYVGSIGPSAEDERDLDWALGSARRARAVSHVRLFDVLEAVLKARWQQRADRRSKSEVLRLARKFQQFTGPAMAKGMEDTAFYRVMPLVSLNEVGMGPRRRITSVSDFHQQMLRRAEQWPLAMVTTATHDTKRSEDVRARIMALSEMPAAWAEHIKRWQTLNRRARREPGEVAMPSGRDEYLFYQTLVGIWPVAETEDVPGPEMMAALRERLAAYMVKAAREAKTHTSWLNPDEDYENALTGFVDQVLAGSAATPFLRDLQSLVRRLERPGVCNALAQMVLRLTMPGVPDTYQGTEAWDDSLVDPDNRRPVDFSARRANLREFRRRRTARDQEVFLQTLCASRSDGRIKHYLLWRLLYLRGENPEVFLKGSYVPLMIEGGQAVRVLAFARVLGDRIVLVAVPRLTSALEPARACLPLAEAWGDTRVDLSGLGLDGDSGLNWWNALTGDRVRQTGCALECAALFADLPVAVLSYASRFVICR